MMNNLAWESSKRSKLEYLRRNPKRTPLYRVVYDYRDDFERCWEDVFKQRYGTLRSVVLESLDEYLNCGVFTSGLALACCESCSQVRVIAFSCKRRGLCPSCDTKRGYVFAEHAERNILYPHPHSHVVFSLPKRLRIYFRYNRRLSGGLFKCAWESWKELLAETFPTASTAGITSLHTAGDLLNFNPHIHGFFLRGVIDETGVFQALTNVNTDRLEISFSKKIFEYLLAENVLNEELIANLQSWSHSGFSVFVGNPIQADDKEARLFVLRYLKKSPIALERLEILKDTIVPTIRYYKSLNEREVYRDFSPLEFLANLSAQIPNKWEQTTRYQGLYSARARNAIGSRQTTELNGKKGTLSVSTTVTQEGESCKKPVSKNWQTWIKRVYEVDPLVCPRCGSSMKIKSFVFDLTEIKRILKFAGISDWKAPPPIKREDSCESYVEHVM